MIKIKDTIGRDLVVLPIFVVSLLAWSQTNYPSGSISSAQPEDLFIKFSMCACEFLFFFLFSEKPGLKCAHIRIQTPEEENRKS